MWPASWRKRKPSRALRIIGVCAATVGVVWTTAEVINYVQFRSRKKVLEKSLRQSDEHADTPDELKITYPFDKPMLSPDLDQVRVLTHHYP